MSVWVYTAVNGFPRIYPDMSVCGVSVVRVKVNHSIEASVCVCVCGGGGVIGWMDGCM